MQVETVTEWLNEWVDVYVKPPCRRENTYLCYKFIISIIKKMRPDLQHTELKDVDELYLQKILNEAASSYSKSTIKKIKTVFKEAYSKAITNHKCPENPAYALEIPEASEKYIRPLTRSEQKAVEEAARKDVLGDIALFFFKSGIRAAELRNLKWDDYNKEKGEIYIRCSKTKKGIRMIPLTQAAIDIIERQPKICEYIFTSTIKKPVTKTVERKLYERLRKATGIKIITNHVYRHSFATRAVEKGMSTKALARIMGHKNEAFTLHRYTEAQDEFLHEQMQLMENKPYHRRFHVKQMHVGHLK